MYERLCGVRFVNGLFRAFDHLDAVIVRWMCGDRFRGQTDIACSAAFSRRRGPQRERPRILHVGEKFRQL
jgi:hypothetical protein